MATVREHFKIGSLVKEDVGIEIEVVGKNLPSDSNVFPIWKREKDDSLRGPETAEYVLRKPVYIDEIKGILSHLKGAFEYNNTKFTDNTTAGTHVHINVQSLTIKQLINFICCYFIVEEIMVDWCHPSRIGNHFCLRAIDAEWLIDAITNVVEHGDFYYVKTDDIRYSSINLLSLFSYGSVEFRALEGCPNFDKLEKWCNILNMIKEKSKLFTDPKDIFSKIREEGIDKFLSSLLEKYTYDIKKEGYVKKIRRGMFIAKDIAYARDWSEINNNIFNKKKNIFS